MKTVVERQQEALAYCREVLLRFLDTTRFGFFLFGSQATGKARRRSDIDIGIIGPEPVNPALLNQLQEIFDESDLLYKVDLIDFFQIRDPDFKRIASQSVQWWNNPANLSAEKLRN
ncbi:nucleotidyltransferase domain-containing protein [Larkinella sp. VNQ87]|uniref:nucleotidyltransferase domain-containing protein n=1 Tax=Larkinella sp. VNQ87 TaxID=3400921 RepID=UPI003C1170B6